MHAQPTTTTPLQATADRDANMRASVLLDELPAGVHAALERLCARLRPLLSPRYAHFLSIDSLVAAQPNLHNGRDYLRPHLDEPLHDGFGIVIVTLAIRGCGQIVLRAQPWDETRGRDYSFPLQARDARARRFCAGMVPCRPGRLCRPPVWRPSAAILCAAILCGDVRAMARCVGGRFRVCDLRRVALRAT